MIAVMLRMPTRYWLLGVLGALYACSTANTPLESTGDECVPADTVYEQRIAPLVSGNRPSSCNQCHLSGIDLGMFVRKTPCQSMACLIEQGEVNLESPKDSKILTRIKTASPESPLITEQVIDEEYSGFLAWIEHSAGCHENQCSTYSDPCGNDTVAPIGAPTPLGFCTEEALIAAFDTYVYRWKGRCAGCHSGNPKSGKIGGPWIDTSDDKNAVMRTMYNVVGLQLIDMENTEKSLILTKPLAIADPSGTSVEHGGGDKLADQNDPSYRDIKTWIDYYAECFKGHQVEPGPQAVAVGACNNEQDGVMLDEYHQVLADCLSFQCTGQEDLGSCLLSCMQGVYSDDCAQCGVGFFECQKAKCTSECAQPESQECMQCTGHQCEASWILCSGVVASGKSKGPPSRQ